MGNKLVTSSFRNGCTDSRQNIILIAITAVLPIIMISLKCMKKHILLRPIVSKIGSYKLSKYMSSSFEILRKKEVLCEKLLALSWFLLRIGTFRKIIFLHLLILAEHTTLTLQACLDGNLVKEELGNKVTGSLNFSSHFYERYGMTTAFYAF